MVSNHPIPRTDVSRYQVWDQWRAINGPVRASITRPEADEHGATAQNVTEQIEELQLTIEQLEQELETKERQNQALIDQYESIIREKNRTLSMRSETEQPSGYTIPRLSDLIARLTDW